MLPIIPITTRRQPLRPSLWSGRKTRVRSRLLPIQIGDGRQHVVLSFFHAPDLEVLIHFDSHVPLDLPLKERCQPNPPPSFRDYLDAIYEHCERLMPRRNWPDILEGGSTWCYA